MGMGRPRPVLPNPGARAPRLHIGPGDFAPSGLTNALLAPAVDCPSVAVLYTVTPSREKVSNVMPRSSVKSDAHLDLVITVLRKLSVPTVSRVTTVRAAAQRSL
jgi:hypothetical protein